jgi:methyltransferase-like protein 23
VNLVELHQIDICDERVGYFGFKNFNQVDFLYAPFYAKIWPASIGMCVFLKNNLHVIKNKTVEEIACGLALPSILATKHAAKVYCSDVEPNAIIAVQKTKKNYNLINLFPSIKNWQTNVLEQGVDVLLISDLNYDPEWFDALHTTILQHLKKCTTIVLSTPQRLLAKPFIEGILPFCIQQVELEVQEKQAKIAISVFVLRIKSDI